MKLIRLQLPIEAVQLMASKTPKGVFDEMITNGVISKIELDTLGMINTPIVDDETGQTQAIVTYWEGGSVSICMADDGDFNLAGIERNVEPPSQDEALELFYKYLIDEEGDHDNIQSTR